MVGRGWEKGGGEEDWLLHGLGILFWGDDKTFGIDRANIVKCTKCH